MYLKFYVLCNSVLRASLSTDALYFKIRIYMTLLHRAELILEVSDHLKFMCERIQQKWKGSEKCKCVLKTSRK